MLTLTEIFVIIIIHWIADFVLQTDKQAKGKSKDILILLKHTSCYSFVWFVSGFMLYLPFNFNGLTLWFICIFSLTTLISHTITDYFTSRLNSKLWSEGKTHYFFVSVGFDQILHYVQLFLTYYLLKQL